MVICLERGAYLHMVQLMPLTVSCFFQIGFTFLVPAHPGSPGQRAVKQVCVCLDQSAPSRFAGLLSSAQRLECDDYSKRAVEVLSRWNSLLGLSLCYSAANFLVPQILVHEDALVNGHVCIFTLLCQR